jgi:hypothetical protein
VNVNFRNRISPNLFAAILFGTFYLWVTLNLLHPMQDPDLWWHLASGRTIIQSRHIPESDPFSLTASGTRWINTYWLYDTAVYLIQQVGGPIGIQIFHVLLVLLLFLLTDQRLRAACVPWNWRLSVLAVLFLGAAPSGGYWGPQASLVTLFFVSLLYSSMDRWEREGWSHSLWLWVPCFFLWANLHRGFVIGLLVAGAYVSSLSRRDGNSRLWGWLFLCVSVTFLTPRPFGTYRMLWDDWVLSPARITGWNTPEWHQIKLFLLMVPTFWLSRFKSRPIATRSWPLTVLALFLTIGGIRQLVFVPYFMFFAVPSTAIEYSGWITHRTSWRIPPSVRGIFAAFLFVLLCLGIRHTRPAWGFPATPVYDFIRRNHLQGPFYNDYLFGGQWIWFFGGNPLVFIDGRYPAVEGYKPLAREIVEATVSVRSWGQFLERYHINTALMKYYPESERPSLFDTIFPRSTWALVYWDDACCLFLRKDGADKEMIPSLEFASVRPDEKTSFFLSRLRTMTIDERRRFAKELIRNAEQHPESYRTREFIELFMAHHLDR